MRSSSPESKLLGPATTSRRLPPRLSITLLCLLAVLGGTSSVLAQLEPASAVIRWEGGNYGFVDEDDPTKIVSVFFGGVDLVQGQRRVRGDTLVAVMRREVDPDAAGQIGLGEALIPGSQILEIFVDGNVSLEEGDELVMGARSLYSDNTKGTVTILDGRWRSSLTETPLIVRYEVMHQLSNGVRELENASYSTCEFEHAHWSVDTPWTRIVPTDEGRVLHTSWNNVYVGGVPILWTPPVHLNLDRDKPPLRSVGISTSNRLGTEINTTWGGDADDMLNAIGETIGADSRVRGDWEFELNNYSSRGVFYQPKWSYSTEKSFGELWGSYIKDNNRRDELDQPIYDDTRGRIKIEHRTKIDADKTLDFELSYISDGNYLREYYEHEDRVGKQQETYINYRDVTENEAFSVLSRARLNNFQTQVEYLPRVERRLAGEQVDTGPFGMAYFTSRDFADSVSRRGEKIPPRDYGAPKPTQPSSQGNVRVGTTGLLEWPLDAGDDRLVVSAGYDLTGFDRVAERQDDLDTPEIDETEVDESGAVRYAVLGGVDWSRTYSGTDSDFKSELWNMDGMRQIIEPRAGFVGAFEVNKQSDDLLAIDNTENLAKRQAFVVGLRHRIQTHQGPRVATTLDTDVSIPFFPNEDRDNNGQTAGLLTVDIRFQPQAEITGFKNGTIRWRSRWDPGKWHAVDSFSSYRNRLTFDKAIEISHNRSRGVSNFLTAGMEWVLTPKWDFAVFTQQDLLLDENSRQGFILRQEAHRWIIDIELSRRRGESRVNEDRGRDDTQVSLRIQPSFGLQDETLLSTLGRIR